MTSSGFYRGFAILSFAAALTGSLLAQHTLYVTDGDTAMRLVRKMDDRNPYVVNNGKLSVPAPSENGFRRYKFQAADEYFPAFVSVRTIKANFARGSSAGSRRLDLQFQFTAAFSTNFRLSEVFFVLEFDTDDIGRKFYVQEVRAADLQQGRPISIEVPLASEASREKYELHVFSNGIEVFHSGMPRTMIDDALRGMVAKRIKDVRDANPKPLTGPIPRYPDNLSSAKGKGQATISCVIAPDGQPQNAKIKSASDPAFGEAAINALSEWWFVPKVVGGKPIESAADLPFEFTPPNAKAKS